MYTNNILVSDSIRKLRNLRGISQEKLAEQVGVSKAHMSRIEAGSRRPGMDTFLKILEVLEVDMNVEPANGTMKEECFIKFKKAEMNLLAINVTTKFDNCIPLPVRAAETPVERKRIYLHNPKGIVADGY